MSVLASRTPTGEGLLRRPGAAAIPVLILILPASGCDDPVRKQLSSQFAETAAGALAGAASFEELRLGLVPRGFTFGPSPEPEIPPLPSAVYREIERQLQRIHRRMLEDTAFYAALRRDGVYPGVLGASRWAPGRTEGRYSLERRGSGGARPPPGRSPPTPRLSAAVLGIAPRMETPRTGASAPAAAAVAARQTRRYQETSTDVEGYTIHSTIEETIWEEEGSFHRRVETEFTARGLEGSEMVGKIMEELEVEYCPSASGIAHGLWSRDEERSRSWVDGSGEAESRSLETRASADLIGQVDDHALLTGIDIKIKVELSGLENLEHKAHVPVRVGKKGPKQQPPVLLPKGIEKALKSGKLPSAQLLAYLEAFGELVRKGAEASQFGYAQAEQRWYGGRCVKVSMAEGPNGTVLNPCEPVKIAADVWHIEAAEEISAPLRAHAEGGKVAPKGPIPSRAEFWYTAPEKAVGALTLETVSKRGRDVLSLDLGCQPQESGWEGTVGGPVRGRMKHGAAGFSATDPPALPPTGFLLSLGEESHTADGFSVSLLGPRRPDVGTYPIELEGQFTGNVVTIEEHIPFRLHGATLTISHSSPQSISGTISGPAVAHNIWTGEIALRVHVEASFTASCTHSLIPCK
jgi:hypothetical protein